MVWNAQLGRTLCDCMAHGMKNADRIQFPRSVLGASGIAIDYLWHSWLQPGLNLACCLSLYSHCRIYGSPPFNNTILFAHIQVPWLEASGWVLCIRCVRALLLQWLITRLLTNFCNHGLTAFYGSSSSCLHSVSRACSRPMLASVGELVTIMLLASSTGGPCAVWLQR